MSTNCLVTKMKGSVNKENLPYLGGMVIEVMAQDGTLTPSHRAFSLVSSKRQTIKSLDGSAIFTTDSTVQSNFVSEFTFEAGFGNTVYLKEGNHKFLIEDKYAITSLTSIDGRAFKFNVEDLEKAADTLAVFFNSEYIYGDISKLSGKTFTDFGINSIFRGKGNITGTVTDIQNMSFAANSHLNIGNNISGNIENIIGKNISSVIFISSFLTGRLQVFLTNNPSVKSFNCRTSAISGSIDTITNPMTDLSIGTSTGSIGGTVEKFVASQVSAPTPRTTGTCSMFAQGTSITFNDTSLGVQTTSIKWRPTTSSVSGAVTDVMSTVANVAITIDADGNKVADATPW